MKLVKGLRFLTSIPDRILTAITATCAVTRCIAKAFGAGMTSVFGPFKECFNVGLV